MNGLDGREEKGQLIGGPGFLELFMSALCAMRGVNSGVDLARARTNAARAFCLLVLAGPELEPWGLGPSGPVIRR
jgi:hypothetical protein